MNKIVFSKTDFFNKVYDIVRLIPHGRVTSYGAIAHFLSSKNSSRIVGWALNHCHTLSPPLPAHRVVNKSGILTGKKHFPNINAMQKKLEKEGIRIVNNQVQDFEKVFWDPIKELL